jgi:hypothetical protein
MEATFFNINTKPSEEDMKIEVREYQGWSINNTGHAVGFWHYETPKGLIHLVSKDDINEVEMYGIIKTVERQLSIAKGLDIVAYIYESEYKPDYDCINKKYYHESLEFDTGIFRLNTDKASERFKCSDFKLNEAKKIITIQYFITKRYKQSKWWRFKNKRKCEVNNYLLFD